MYKAVKNIGTNNMEVPFDFYTYTFPKGKTVLAEEKLAQFLEESWPKNFEFSDETKGISVVDRVKTRVLIRTQEKTQDMVTSRINPQPTFGGADLTPVDGTVDKDGVGWYGEGITVEGGTL